MVTQGNFEDAFNGRYDGSIQNIILEYEPKGN
jgi:hypothetical protein